MNINNMRSFSREFAHILTNSIDGISCLAWSIFFLLRGICRILANGEIEGGAFNLIVPIILLLILIRMRINDDHKSKFNIGSIISVNLVSIILLKA